MREEEVANRADEGGINLTSLTVQVITRKKAHWHRALVIENCLISPVVRD